jgi:transposase
VNDLPAPMVPADVELRDMDGFMLNAERLLSSELWALSTGDQFKAAVALWCRAWKQTPAASLPDDDRILAGFAGLDQRRWKAIRDVAMRGFVLCSDGRFYHRVLAEDALRAWEKKIERANDRAADRERLRLWRESKKAKRNGDETADETRFNSVSKHARNSDETSKTGTGTKEREDTSSSVLNSASHSQTATGDDDAVAIIGQFDESRSAAFGADQARQWPNQTDHLTAKRLAEAGASPAFCRPVFDAVNAKLKAKGHKPRDRLSAMEGDVVSALEARAKPAAAPNGHAKPTAPVGPDDQFVKDVILRVVQKRSGKDGIALQQAYVADPIAGLAEAKRIDAELRAAAR